MEEKNTSIDINENVLFNLVYAIETAEDFTKEDNIPEDLKENFSRWWDQRKRRTSKQLQKGMKINTDFTLILAEDELKNKEISIKNFETREQITIKREDLDKWLKKNC